MGTKVLHVISSLAGGGAERQLVDLVVNTTDNDLSHIVCSIGSADFFADDIRRGGGTVIMLDLDAKYPWVRAARRIAGIVKRESPNVIHSWLYNADIVSRLVNLRSRNIPLVTSLASPSYEPETVRAGGWRPWKVEGLRMIDSGLAKLTRPFFVACSEFVASSAERRLGVDRSRIKVIYNSVDTNTLKSTTAESQAVREELGIPKDAFVYVSVGRLDAGKGYAYLIRSFIEVARSVPDAYLTIIGTGPIERELRELVSSLELRGRVILSGRRRDIGACLGMGHVFVFPTLFEGFGIAMVEAMSKGLPTIASRLPVIEEIVENGVSGILVEPGDEAEWTREMLRIHGDSELRGRIGLAGRARARNTFDSRVLIPQWRDLYHRISDS